MKKIEAIIKPFLLDDLHTALLERGFVAITVSEIQRFQQLQIAPIVHQEKIVPIEVDFRPRLKVELVVKDEDAEEAAAIFQQSGQANKDALVIQHLDDVVRIRTSEHGAIAV
ncbi:MAG: P-II family nitrogen regulator [Verrucomicrobiota bacterium]